MDLDFKEHAGSLNKTKSLTGRFCERPFELLEIQRDFFAYSCCPSWLPKIIGNCETDDLMEVWNSETSQEIRRSILEGDFKYCDQIECPRIQQGTLPFVHELNGRLAEIVKKNITKLSSPPREIALCYDESCNLACPSCRRHKINFIAGPEFERRMAYTDRLLTDIKQYVKDQQVILRVTGSGDPISSKIFRHLLRNLDGMSTPNLKIVLQTNAVMLTEKVWQEMSNIHNNIQCVSVSVDAASEATYSKVRKFGNWQQLNKNLKFIADLSLNGEIEWMSLNFVVQENNYHEMGDFVRLGKQLPGLRDIFFSFVNDWQTWEKEEYQRQCIWKSGHPKFTDFMQYLKDPVLEDPLVLLGNLTEYRQQALQS